MANEFGTLSLEEMVQASMMGKDIPWESPEGKVPTGEAIKGLAPKQLPDIVKEGMALAADPYSAWGATMTPWGEFKLTMNPEDAGPKKPKPEQQSNQNAGTKPTQQTTTTPTSPSSVSNQVGFGPALSALTGSVGGPSASNLAGLTPDQIMAVVGQGNQARALEQKTIDQLIDVPVKQAYSEYLRSRPQKEVATSRLDFWVDGKKQSAMIPKGGFNEAARSVLEQGGALEAPGKTPLWEHETDLRSYDDLSSFIFDKKGKMVDNPDVAGLESLNKTLMSQDREIVSYPVKNLIRKKWGFDWLKGDLPAKDVYVIVGKGKNPTKPDVIRALVGMYGYTREEAEEAIK